MNHAACPAERGGVREKIRLSHAVDGIGMADGAMGSWAQHESL